MHFLHNYIAAFVYFFGIPLTRLDRLNSKAYVRYNIANAIRNGRRLKWLK